MLMVNEPSSLADVFREWERAKKLHPTDFNSAHEGFAVLQEEVDELWAEVKKRDKDPSDMYVEAVQVAAMALRFLTDVCPRGDTP